MATEYSGWGHVAGWACGVMHVRRRHAREVTMASEHCAPKGSPEMAEPTGAAILAGTYVP